MVRQNNSYAQNINCSKILSLNLESKKSNTQILNTLNGIKIRAIHNNSLSQKFFCCTNNRRYLDMVARIDDKSKLNSLNQEYKHFSKSVSTKKHRLSDKITKDTVGKIRDKVLSVNVAFESWYKYWTSISMPLLMHADVETSPSFTYYPSISISKEDQLLFQFSYQASNIQNFNVGFTNTVKPASSKISEVASEIIYSLDLWKFRTKLQLTKFNIAGKWSFIEDTIYFENKTEYFRINNKEIIFDLLVGKGEEANPSLLFGDFFGWIGIRYVYYNRPLLVYGEEIIDPRNPNDTLVKVEILNTKINYIAPIFDVFGSYGMTNPNNKKFEISFQGYWLLFPLGIGLANNDWQKNAFVFSSIGAGQEIDIGINLKLGLNSRPRVNYRSSLNIRIGGRLFLMKLYIPKNKNYYEDLTEFYYGPYFQISITI